MFKHNITKIDENPIRINVIKLLPSPVAAEIALIVVRNLVVDFVVVVLLAVVLCVLEESTISVCWYRFIRGKTFQSITFILNAGDTSHFSDATGAECRVRTMQKMQLVSFAPASTI